MRRQTIAILLAGLVLFGVGIGAALGVIGNEKAHAPAGRSRPARPARTMPGMTMTGVMSTPAETAERTDTMPMGSMPGMDMSP